MNEEYINNSNIETESVVEDSSINEMEKSFTEEAMETSQENTETESIEEDISNDLKRIWCRFRCPDLFSSETENSTSEDLLSSNVKMKRMILKYQHS